MSYVLQWRLKWCGDFRGDATTKVSDQECLGRFWSQAIASRTTAPWTVASQITASPDWFGAGSWDAKGWVRAQCGCARRPFGEIGTKSARHGHRGICQCLDPKGWRNRHPWRNRHWGTGIRGETGIRGAWRSRSRNRQSTMGSGAVGQDGSRATGQGTQAVGQSELDACPV